MLTLARRREPPLAALEMHNQIKGALYAIIVAIRPKDGNALDLYIRNSS
jgi:hypothetical protein